MSVFEELKRRNVFRVGIAYLLLGWLVLQVTDVIVPIVTLPDWVGRLVLLLLVLGFPLVLFFAWAFELTPGGLKREREVDRSESVTAQTGRKLDRAIIVVLLVALGWFAWERFFKQGPEVADNPALTQAPASPAAEFAAAPEEISPSIAVLPFANMSADPDNEYFSDGISEEILNLLARLPGLHVTSRSSSFQFKGEDVHIPTVAKQLGVAHVLEGSVRKAGNRVRVTAQLIDARADRHLWSDAWDRELDDVFAIQDEIAASVVEVLQRTLLGEVSAAELESSRPTDPQAYELYLRGRHLTWQRSRAPLVEAERLLREAIEIDPEYAPAYTALAIALLFQVQASGEDIDVAAIFRDAEAAIDRALEIEPGMAEAYSALGLLRRFQGRHPESIAAFEKAIGLNPNDGRTYFWFANEVGSSDPVRELQLARKAYEIDPLQRIVVAGLAWKLIPHGRYAEAMDQARKYHALFPDTNWAYRTAADVFGYRGRVDLAVKSLYAAYRTQPEAAYGFLDAPFFFQALGEPGLAAEWLAVISPLMSSWPQATFAKVGLHASNGEYAQAIEWARRKASEYPDQWFDVALAQALWLSGDFQAARQVLVDAFPEMGQNPPTMNPWFRVAAIDLAMVMQRTGEADRASILLEQARGQLEEHLSAGVVSGPPGPLHSQHSKVLALQGQTEAAIDALRSAERAGGLICIFCLRHFPHWDALRPLPEFETVIGTQETRLEEQRLNLAEQGMLLTPEEVLASKDLGFDPLAEQQE